MTSTLPILGLRASERKSNKHGGHESYDGRSNREPEQQHCEQERSITLVNAFI